MRTAVLLTGHTRSWDKCVDSFKKYILKPFSPDIFIHTWQEPNIPTNNNKINYLKVYDLKELLPISYVSESWENVSDELEKRSKFFTRKNHYDDPVNTLSQHRKWFLCNELKKIYEKQNNFIYDVVIRTRIDLKYENELPINLNYDIITTPEEYSFNIISDVMCITSSTNMNLYCDIFNKEEEIYTKYEILYNPHTVLKNYLDHVNLKYEKTKLNIKIEK